MRNIARLLTVIAFLVAVGAVVAEQDAFARVGGGRSFGSRGSRSYSVPAPSPSQSPSRQYSPSQPAPSQPSYPGGAPYQQPNRGMGSFGRGLLGGLAGGFLGGMLSRSLGFGGGWGGGGGGGIGLFEILLFAGIGYGIYRLVRRRSDGSADSAGGRVIPMSDYQREEYYQPQAQPVGSAPEEGDLEAGLAHIRRMDPSFDERRFGDQVMDLFFRIQGAWMNRDLSGVSQLLTDEMRALLQQDVESLLKEHKINRLENIAVRSVEISEAWQEQGMDYLTALIYANLLDYTTDDRTGAVLAGSKTDPVKFEEYWTFVRPVGNNPWRLSAINQK